MRGDAESVRGRRPRTPVMDNSKARIGCHDEGSRRAWRSRRSRIGIKFIDPMNRTYGVELPEYQNTENPKYQKSKVPNTLMKPYIYS